MARRAPADRKRRPQPVAHLTLRWPRLLLALGAVAAQPALATALPVLDRPLYMASTGTSTTPSRVYRVTLDDTTLSAYVSEIATLPPSTFGSTLKAAMVHPHYPERVYVFDSTTTKLGYVDVSTGALTTVGTVNVNPDTLHHVSLGAFAANGDLYLAAQDERLLVVDASSGAITVDAVSGYNLFSGDFAFDNSGALVGFSGSSRRFFRYDALPSASGQTVTATEIGSTQSIVYAGVAIVEIDGVQRLLASSNTGLTVFDLSNGTSIAVYTWREASTGLAATFAGTDLAASPNALVVPEPGGVSFALLCAAAAAGAGALRHGRRGCNGPAAA